MARHTPLMGETIRSPRDWKFIGLASVLVAGSFFLRIPSIGLEELFVDEALSFHKAITAGGWRPDVVGDPSPPLYYLLLRLWIPLTGTDETSLRLLSAVLGTVFVLVTIWAGCVLFNRRVGLWSGAFAALSPMQIYYSQDARPYALLVTLIMFTIGLFWLALRNGSRMYWALASAAALLTIFTHYLAVLALIPVLGLALVGSDPARVRQQVSRTAKAAVVCAVVFLPWYWWAWVSTPHPAAETSWIRQSWELGPPLLLIPKTLEVLALGGQADIVTMGFSKTIRVLTFPWPLHLLGLSLFLLLGVWVALPWLDDRLGILEIRAIKTRLWAMLFIPLALLWLISLHRPIYLVGRYDIIVLPAFVLLTGLGMAKVQSAVGGRLLLPLCLAGTLAAVMGMKVVRYYEAAGSESPGKHRATAKALASNVTNGDVVVLTGLRGMPVLYYLHGLGFAWTGTDCVQPGGKRFGCRMFPLEIERAPATEDTARVLESPEAISEEVQVFLSALSKPDNVLWFVLGNGGYSDVGLRLPEPELSLMVELQARKLQFEYVQMESAPGIFRVARHEFR